jgi:tripartite ATP-independent transporter DctP family solute receptor
VKSQTHGRITIQIFPNNQLGSLASVVQAVQAGSIDFQVVDPSNLAAIVPSAALLSGLPFEYASFSDAYKILDGKAGEAVAALFNGTGIKILSYGDEGFKIITNSKHPINSPADLKGLKMRSIASPLVVTMWQALGAQPTTIDISEVYTSLAAHTVDGWDTTPDYALSQKFYEIQKYGTVTNHIFATDAMVVSAKTWATLSSSDQKIIQTAMTNAVHMQRTLVEAAQAAAVSGLQSNGMQIILNPTIADFRAAVQPVYTQAAQKYGTSILGLIVSLPGS